MLDCRYLKPLQLNWSSRTKPGK